MVSPTQRPLLAGVRNVVWFNWPTYAASVGVVLGLGLAAKVFDAGSVWLALTAALVALPVGISLVATAWVYDVSNLYQLSWLDRLEAESTSEIVLVNAGFDEVGPLISARLPSARIHTLDFYAPDRTPEPSIARARARYPLPNDTIPIRPHELPLAKGTIDLAVAFMSAHELRDWTDRTALFHELRRILHTEGRVVVVEHQRDLANALAYTIGVLHFFSPASWRRLLQTTGFAIEAELHHTPLVRTFIGRPAP